MTTITSVKPVEPIGVSIKDARVCLGNSSHQKIYDLINAGELETSLIGGRRIVILESLRALVERNKSRLPRTKSDTALSEAR